MHTESLNMYEILWVKFLSADVATLNCHFLSKLFKFIVALSQNAKT